MMLSQQERILIIELIKREVIPAIGCTEPIAVALAVTHARELLGTLPDRIEVNLSANVLKNSLGVAIPGTSMMGLPIAIALGALIGKSEYGLEVLKDVTEESVIEGEKLISDKRISISVKEDISEKLFIEAIAYFNNSKSRVIISKEHTRVTFMELNGKIMMLIDDKAIKRDLDNRVSLNFEKVCHFALETPLSEISFIKQSVDLNRAAANESMKGNYGLNVSSFFTDQMFGGNVFNRMLSVTAAACDARMSGAMFPVMSNSGSGNQGIAATLPVIVYAEETNKTEEDLIRALTLSHLMTIYIKQSIGRLSGFCGAIVAATGAACGLTYLMGGNNEQIAFAIKNMIGNVAGMICDGAKPSCALKVSNGVSTAILSAMMAIGNKVISHQDGITDKDVDKTIQNLAKISKEGMNETDRLIMEIMTNK